MTVPALNARARGWLRFLWRKATTPDDWSEAGEPHPWWDRYSSEPVLNFARFDLSESAYAVGIMADRTPAWREVYGRILDELVRRHTTYWAAIDWLTQIGPDPRRNAYPDEWIATYLPKHLVGRYDVPGWTANGVAPWGLQPDPIGADGNLFFKGWLNLVMTLSGYVSGRDLRHDRFDVAGVGGTRFEWTQARLADWLVELWQRHPAGPHCENTKVWPFCLNAAGLGLSLYDTMFASDRHQAWQRWSTETRGDYFGVEDGRLKWVALYWDPIVRHKQTVGPSGGFANALYLLPQDPAFAELLYHGAVARMGWNDPRAPIQPTPDPRFLALGRILARELGDDRTDRRLGDYAEQHFEPRFFGRADSEFGWWFRLGEPWPRGQLSAIMMMAEVGGVGAWTRLFRQPNLTKFAEPTVEGVDFPSLGVSSAWNDPATGLLHVETYPADGEADRPTTFRVTGLGDLDRVRVRCDGQEHQRWHRLGPGAIAIETDLATHRFEIAVDRRSPDRPSRSGTERMATPVAGGQAAVRSAGRGVVEPRSVTMAAGAMELGGLGCPCCR
ncbi:MAG: hypothetical protein AB7R55_21840 [Gemmatimonadales bacterium]